MTNVTGSDRMISLGLRARAALESLGGRVPGGQCRDDDGVLWRWSDEADWDRGGPGHLVPDVADPATVGCLLALAREAWGDPTITTHCWRLSPAAIARKPGRGPEQWSAAGAPVKALILDEQAATDWRTAPGWDDSPRGPYGALCPSFRASSEAESLIAAILAAPQPSREASDV